MAESSKIPQIAEQLINLTVKEVKELEDLLREEHGIEPIATATPIATTPSAEEEKETQEKTSFNVVLTTVGPSKLAVVKAVKSIKACDLKTAKELVESQNPTIKENISKAEAEETQKLLQEAGATVELK